MSNQIFRYLMSAIAVVFLLSFDMPKNWMKAGSAPNSYEMGIVPGAAVDGGNAATIRSIEKISRLKFGTMSQWCLAEKYLGKRVKMSGYMKSENVKAWAGFWFRVDGKDKKRSLSFDNMYHQRVKGTTAWKKYEVVLDVPENASRLAYGALISGAGQIWFCNLSFEIVDTSVQTTGY